MDASLAHPEAPPLPQQQPRWKTSTAWIASVLLALLFAASGIWKLSDLQATAVRMTQARVPDALSLPAAFFFAITETLAAIMILVPRLRRWAALIMAGMLIAFMAYFTIHYHALRGEDCSCIPWLKRVVGPGFFVGDTAMLLLAGLAWFGAPRARGLRTAGAIAAAVALCAGLSYGIAEVRQTGVRAPESVLVDGRPYSLAHGRVLLFYFDPACTHCFESAQRMSHLHWKQVRIVGIPAELDQFAPAFIRDTGFSMPITSDRAKLKAVFPFVGVPAAVAVENGRQKAMLTAFDGPEPARTLQRLGFIE
jgi:uncharacterized membrane protein YphA (DoxX/SURF4 family)